jgi:uncharacterized membrane protein
MTASPPQRPPVDAGPPDAAAGRVPAVPAQPGRRDERDAVLAYRCLAVPVAGVIALLPVYLASRRRSALARAHAAEALRAWCAATLYDICVLIIGAMLALDSVRVAAAVAVPLALALWLVVAGFGVRGARAARRGEPYEFPGWLRVSASSQVHDRG